MWRPAVQNLHVSLWLCYALVLAGVHYSETLSDAELDSTLDAHNTEYLGGKILNKLRAERAPFWHSADTGITNLDDAREYLQLTSIDKDPLYYGPIGIKKWLTLKVGAKVYGVGLADHSVTLLTAKPHLSREVTYTYSHVSIEFAETVIDAATFSIWHPKNATLSAYVIVAAAGMPTTLSWYLIKNDGLVELHKTSITESVREITVSAISSENLVLILNACAVDLPSPVCLPRVNIYQFHPWKFTDIKLSQSITISSPASISVGTHRDEVLLAISVPALGKVLLYRHVWPSSSDTSFYDANGILDNLYGYFKNYDSIVSEGVTQAVFFVQNYKTWLAVNGLSRAIYKVTDDLELVGSPTQLEGLRNVLTWAIIPIPTYTQDVVILAQFEAIDRDGVSIKYAISALTLSSGGKVITIQDDYTCQVVPDTPPQTGSASCLFEIGGYAALAGAATLPLGRSSFASLLVPNDKWYSSLVRLHTQFIELPDPVIAKVDLLNDMRMTLETEIAEQEKVIHELEVTLSETLRTDGNNIITGSWVIDEMKSSFVEVEDASSINKPTMVGKTPSDNWSKADFEVNLPDVTSQYVQLESLVKSIKEDLENVLIRNKDGIIEMEGMLTVIGGLEIESTASFEFLVATILNGEPVNAILQDAVRLDSLRQITGHKSIPSLEADNVIFSSVNNIPASELIFDSVSDFPIVINGSLHFNYGLKTDTISLPEGGKVNGIDISEEVFLPANKIPVPVFFEKVSVIDVQSDLVNNIVLTPESFHAYTTWGLDQSSLNGNELDSVQVDGNVLVEYINGEYWRGLVNSVVWTDRNVFIPGDTSISKIVSEQGVGVSYLNGLPFPDEYVVRTRPGHTITGEKYFNGGLFAGDVDVATINDIDVDSIVTLHSNQVLDGVFAISSAYFGTDIKVDSKLNGVNVDAINRPSPVLGEAGPITVDVDIGQLQVDGPIVVLNSQKTSPFADIVSDIVVIPEPNSPDASKPIVINGGKSISTLTSSSLTVTSKLINNIPVDGIVTTNTHQIFKQPIVASNHVDFGNVNLTGRWDGIDLNILKKDVMTVSGNQKISAHLTFTNPSELWANRLNIEELNNGLTDESVLVTFVGSPDGENDLLVSENGEVIVDGPLGAAEIQVDGNVIVKGKVCDVNILKFDESRLSITKPQMIIADMRVDHLEIRQHLNASTINQQIPAILQQNYVTAPTDLEAGGYVVDELFVEGDIETTFGVNQLRIDKIAADAIRLDYMNSIEGNLVFKDPVYFGTLEAHSGVNDLDLSRIEADAILKDQDVVLNGHTTFWQGIFINGDLDTPNVLGLNPANVLTKDKDHVIKALRVSRNVFVSGDVDIDVSINGEAISKITGRYKLLDKGRHQIIGDLKMSGQVAATDLFVDGKVHNENLEEFFSSTVDRYLGGVIKGNVTFLGEVNFLQPVSVDGTVNNIDLSDYYENLVLINGSYTEIESKVIFEDTLSAGKVLTVDDFVDAETFYGCNVSDWYVDGVLINEKAELQGSRSFEDVITQSLDTRILNGIDMSKVILLNNDQTIDYSLNFANITANRLIEVEGLINGVDLYVAFKNTLLTKDDYHLTGQEIANKVFTGPVIVDGNLNVESTINELDVTKAVTLNTDQIITGPLLIQSTLTALADVSVSQRISGVDVVAWSQQVVFVDSADVQTITTPWNIIGNVTFTENVGGSGLLSGVSVASLEAMKKSVHDQVVNLRSNLTKQWEAMCFEVKSLAIAAQKQPFFLQRIDVIQGFTTPLNINSINIFQDGTRTYLFVSYRYSCFGALHIWSAVANRWNLLDHNVINGGGIARWLTVPSPAGTYLATSAEYNGLNCSNYGGRVWKFNRGLENDREIAAWKSGKVDPVKPEFYTLSEDEVHTYRIDNGELKLLQSRTFKSTSPSAYLMARSSNEGLLVKDGSVVSPLEDTSLGAPDSFLATLLESVKNIDYISVFTKPDGKRLVAVFEERSRSLMIHNLDLQMAVGRISAKSVRFITPMELGDAVHPGQTHIAFVEGDSRLRVFQYKGEQGFVEVVRIQLPVKVIEMVAVRLPSRGLLRDRVYLIVRGSRKVLTLEVEMLGDPLPDDPPSCSLNNGF